MLHELKVHQIELEMQNDELRRVQQELETSRERYFDLYNLAPVGYVSLDQEGMIFEANRMACTLLGYQDGTLLGRPLKHVILFADEELFLEHYAKAVQSRSVQVCELRLAKFDGTHFWARLQSVAFGATDGSSVLRVAISDITERKRAEESLQEAYHAIEETVQARTRELQVAIAELVRARQERETLQSELLRISEHEKLLIAQELHDGLCQHLSGTAMMGGILARRLAERGAPEAGTAKQICDLLNMGTEEARNLSYGLNPVQPAGEGLMQGLLLYSTTTTKLFHIDCSFRCPEPVTINSPSASNHLFRIAQEAVTNALKHGKAKRVVISLAYAPRPRRGIVLSIRDNGEGIPADLNNCRGQGMQVMHYRADSIGASLKVTRRAQGGTLVKCSWSGDFL